MVPRLPNEPLDPAEWAVVTLDIGTLTLGECSRAEAASGMTIAQLSRGASLKLLAMYIHGLRTYDVPPSWSELSNLRVSDVTSSTSRASSDGPPPKSNG